MGFGGIGRAAAMSDTSSGNDWELVTGVISSHPSLDSTSNDAGVEGGAEGGPDGGN